MTNDIADALETPESIPRSNPRTMILTFLSGSASNVAERGLFLISGIVVRRALGPEAVGLVSWAQALGTYPAIFLSPGFSLIARREIAREPNQSSRYLSLMFSLQLPLAIISGIFLAIFAFSFVPSANAQLLILLQIVSLFLIPIDMSWILLARDRITRLSIALTIAALCRAVSIFLLIHSPNDLLIYAIIQYPFQLFLCIYVAYYAWRQGLIHPRALRFHIRDAVPFLRESLPLTFMLIFGLIYTNSDTVILGITGRLSDVGQYSTAYGLMLISSLISTSLTNTYLPLLARVSDDPVEATAVSSQFLSRMLALGFPIAAVSSACGPFIVNLLYGPTFSEAGMYLRWLSLNITLMWFGTALSQPLLMWGGQRANLMSSVTAGIANLLGNVALIPTFGVNAAIATTLGAGLIQVTGTILIRRRYHPIPLLRPLIRALAVAIAIAIASFLFMSTDYQYIGLLGSACLAGAGILYLEPTLLRRLLRVHP